MKKGIFVLSVLMLAGFAGMAQFKKGTRLFGASLASAFINTAKGDVTAPGTAGFQREGNSFNLGLTPSYGWFTKENLAFGVNMTVQTSGSKYFSKFRDTSFIKDNSSTYSVGIGGFARYYLGKNQTGSTRTFAQLALGAGIGGGKSDGFAYGSDAVDSYFLTYDNKVTSNVFYNAGLTLGLTHMLNSHVGLDLGIGYSFVNNKNVYKNTTKYDYKVQADVTLESNQTYVIKNHGVNISAGFQIFLDPKK